MVVTLAGVALGVRGIWVLPRLWRNEQGWDPDRPPATWSFGFWSLGVTSWRGLVRCNILAIAIFLFFPPGYALDNAGADGTLAEIVIAASMAISGALAVMMVSVFLFNEPKRVVVPHLRHQHGAIAEWLGEDSAPTPAPTRTPPVPLR